MLYDPMYGLPKDNIEEIDPVYRRQLEDMIFSWDRSRPQYRKAIAKLA